MKKLIKFLNLNRYKQRLLIQTYALLTLVRLGLFLLGFQTLKNLLIEVSQYQKPEDCPITTKDIARAVNHSSRLSPGTVKCLAKALTTNTLMNLYRLPCRLCIGVAKGQDKSLEAHAWVEAEGKIVVGYLPDLARFETMASTEKESLLL